jgi:hypothetical protein
VEAEGEEDVDNVEASRSGDSVEGGPQQGGEVARLTGVSLCSVKRIAQEGPVVHVDDAAERVQRQVGRPSRVVNFRKPILAILQQEPDLAALEILRRARESGYEGGKTALYALVASSQVGQAPGSFRRPPGGIQSARFWTNRSGVRRWQQPTHSFLRLPSEVLALDTSEFSLVQDEAVESLVRTLAEHLASWGGLPLRCVFDRPKTIALQWKEMGR